MLFHVLNGSATEIRSLALPGHTFTVVAMDGNPIPKPVTVPGLWLGTAERISAIVEMNHPGVWIMGEWPTTIGSTAWASWWNMPARRETAVDRSQAVPVELRSIRESPGAALPPAGSSLRHDLRQAKRGRGWLQSVDHQRCRVCGRSHASDVSGEAGQAVPVAHAQRQRRHPSGSPAPPQFRADGSLAGQPTSGV